MGLTVVGFFSKRCLLTNKKIMPASMWCVVVVLDLGNEYRGGWSCLLSRVLQRIIFQQSFMHSSHSSHLLGKICCVRSFQVGPLFSWCSLQAWVKGIKNSSNKLTLFPTTYIFLEVQENSIKVKNQQSTQMFNPLFRLYFAHLLKFSLKALT